MAGRGGEAFRVGTGSGERSRRAGSGVMGAVEKGLPEGEDHEVAAQLAGAGFADLADAFLGEVEFARDVIERGVLQVVAADDVGVVVRQAVERGLQRGRNVLGLGGLRRTRGIAIDEDVARFAGFVGFMDRAGVGRGRERLDLVQRFQRESGGLGDFGRRGDTTGGALELKRGLADGVDLAAAATGKRIEATEFVEHGSAHPGVTERGFRATATDKGFDQGHLSRAGEVLARDMRG